MKNTFNIKELDSKWGKHFKNCDAISLFTMFSLYSSHNVRYLQTSVPNEDANQSAHLQSDQSSVSA